MARKKTKTLRQLINDAVVASGLSHTRWCKQSGLNPRLVYRWLCEDLHKPQTRSIGALATALGVDYETAEKAVSAAQKG